MPLFILLFALLSGSAHAQDCTRLWRNGFPDPATHGSTMECDEFRPALTGLHPSLRMFTAHSLSLSEDVKLQMEIIAEALQYSVNKYRTFGRVPMISLVRHDQAHYAEAANHAFTFVEFFNLDSEACPIVVYPVADVLSKPHLQQLIAHEVFHCVQKANFKDQTTAAVQGGEGLWWFEGLAQLFSNVVYPSNDFEYSDRFPAPDQTVPFYDQPNAYSSENFWQSYLNLIDTSLFGAQRLMPTAAGSAASDVVMRLPRISEALHEYGKQISMKKVRDSSGAVSPYDMELEPHLATQDNHQEINLSYFDFTVGAYEITLPKGSQWNIRFDLPSHGSKVSMKKAEDENYAAVSGSTSMTTTCDEERKIHVVITRAAADMSMNGAKMVLDRTDNPDCDCTAEDAAPQIDECLVGSWQLDHSSVPQFWQRLAPEIEFLGSTGAFIVTLTADHQGTWTAGNWTLRARKEMSHGMVMTFTQVTNGTSTFSYNSGNGKVCSRGTSMNMSTVKTVDINGHSQTQPGELPFDSSNAVFTYTCTPDHFIYQEIRIGSNVQLMNYIFRKL